MKRKIIMILSIMALVLFSGCNNLKNNNKNIQIQDRYIYVEKFDESLKLNYHETLYNNFGVIKYEIKHKISENEYIRCTINIDDYNKTEMNKFFCMISYLNETKPNDKQINFNN